MNQQTFSLLDTVTSQVATLEQMFSSDLKGKAFKPGEAGQLSALKSIREALYELRSAKIKLSA